MLPKENGPRCWALCFYFFHMLDNNSYYLVNCLMFSNRFLKNFVQHFWLSLSESWFKWPSLPLLETKFSSTFVYLWIVLVILRPNIRNQAHRKIKSLSMVDAMTVTEQYYEGVLISVQLLHAYLQPTLFQVGVPKFHFSWLYLIKPLTTATENTIKGRMM